MDWKVAYTHRDKERKLKTIREIMESGLEIIPAAVPGNFELDLMRAGKLNDLYFSTNTLEAQKLEDIELWYFTTVFLQNHNQYLQFDGIDTIADIYVNGQLITSTDNMHISYDVDRGWQLGENEVVVHIKPVMLEARKFETPAVCSAQRYNFPSLHVRKAGHMFGWDIMPRIVSAGIWKEVSIREKKTDYIQDVYLVTNSVDLDRQTAKMHIYINSKLSGNFVSDYSVRVEGVCKDSSFLVEETLWHTCFGFNFQIQNSKFWWPKNAGEQNLYDVKISLIKNGTVLDTNKLKIGIRTVELDRTEVTDRDGNGEFCFKVNGKKIFVLGTNWVPLDAFHSNDSKRLGKALELLDDIGCNMVRCWGGNVYESDEFFDFCDAHGIMVWQDFSMGCAGYPWDKEFCSQLEEEAVYQVKRLRNHPSLALWAGDNENDLDCGLGFRRNPNVNLLTRELLPRVVEMHDYARPFLPSSPYICDRAFKERAVLPENHLWGPRDYFKGDFYRNTFCHFASEIGYHGFPSPQSLKRFLREPEKLFEENGNPTKEYLVHAACMEPEVGKPYSYRIKLAYKQVETLFGKAAEKWSDFLKQSQISQAEAKKYFIEKFRIGKWKRTGIIWWNLIDGWPQVSDAVVDYYYAKKLAYHYIKRSQEPLCLMFDEPADGSISLVAVNDTPEAREITYTVKRVSAVGEDEEILSGSAAIEADSSSVINHLPIKENEKEFYLIEWVTDGRKYANHYFTNILNIDYHDYIGKLSKCGLDQFEGFEE